MLLALVLAAAPVTVSLTADQLLVGDQPVTAEFGDAYLNLPALEERLRSLRTDAGVLDVRIEVAPATRFQRLARVLFTAASAGVLEPEVRIGQGTPFRAKPGRAGGVMRLTPTTVAIGAVVRSADAGVPGADALRNAFGPPSAEALAQLAIDDSMSLGAVAPFVERCLREGYRVVLVPLDVPAGASTSAGPVVMGSLDKELIRKVIHANRGQVRACYEALLAKKPAAEGKVSVANHQGVR